ncbi:MAG: hypothetical protein V1793_07775 [Pseudomonadota bacterium]
MKKVFTLVMVMMLALVASAWAELCPLCPKSSCPVPELCKTGQGGCEIDKPCSQILTVCDCDNGTFFKDGDKVGVSVESLTPGVYWHYGYGINVKLFPFLNNATTDDANIYDACDWRRSQQVPWDFSWAAANSLVYLRAGDIEVSRSAFQSASAEYAKCTIPTNGKITKITTCTKNSWTIDVNPSGNTDGDNQGNGEDGYIEIPAGSGTKYQKKYLLIDIPEVHVDWAEVEAAGLKGTVARGKVCILDAKDSENSICTSCTPRCCCTFDTVKLCAAEDENCIYFPYSTYGLWEDGQGWSAGIAITNTSLDNSATSVTDAPVSIGDMIAEFTVVDSTGAVFTKTYTNFEKAITVFNVDDLIDNILELDGVAAGSIYIKVKANFNIDGYHFVLSNDNQSGISFGGGTLARECVWPYGDEIEALETLLDEK